MEGLPLFLYSKSIVQRKIPRSSRSKMAFGFCVFLSWFSFAVHGAEVDTGDLLKKSDFFRGGRVEGVVWELKVENIEQGELRNEIRLKVEASYVGDQLNALISFLGPKQYEGERLLLRSHNMWFSKPGLRRPVPISSRQRLTGSASNADVASANYYEDYSAVIEGEESVNGVSCYVVHLEAKTNLVSYPVIKYWISKIEKRGLKAEFYGKAERLIKSAEFRYDNHVTVNGTPTPYISNVVIVDGINRQNKTILSISNVRFEAINDARFQKDRLLD